VQVLKWNTHILKCNFAYPNALDVHLLQIQVYWYKASYTTEPEIIFPYM